ncbi:MAG TPA: serine/threonine-protein kinase, partial [Roseiflexaceae bacterium]|nr:serine/threonine-protein kinase [Roseiflexaceae bacterium]
FDDQPGSVLSGPAWQVVARDLSEAEIAAPLVALPPSIGVYQLLAPLGRGGMGEVHLALDTRLQRKVALKLLPIAAAGNYERLRRFTQEARAASALNHPNIVVIHDIGEFTHEAQTLHYLVTEYVEGVTLRQRMQAPLPVSDALDIALQIAAALAAAHEAGIIHRDIKPENVMIRRDGLVKVLDFGLAKLIGSKSEEEAARSTPQPFSPAEMLFPVQSTASSAVMGTPRYMSPEQANGETVDTRTDLFSLGVMLYEMVTGRPPFTGETPRKVLDAILRDAPPPLLEVSPDAYAALEPVLERALRKPREERYQSIQEFAAELSRLQRELEPTGTVTDHIKVSSAVTAGTLPLNARQTIEQLEAQTTMRYGLGVSAQRWLLSCGVLAVIAGSGWWAWRTTKVKQARTAVPRIEQLAQAERYFEAYDLAQAVKAWLPNDPTLTRLMPLITDQLTVTSQPLGARVYLKRFLPEGSSQPAERQFIGVTPIHNHQLARGGYLLTLEKEGYESFERTVTGLNLHVLGITS